MTHCRYPWLAAMLVAASATLSSAAVPVETSTTTSAKARATSGPVSVIPVARTRHRDRFMNLHKSHLERARQKPIDLLFLGDSITERWTSSPQVWEKHFGQWNPANFGIGGDRTQNVLWRIENGALDNVHPKVLVLLIGTNNANSDSAEAVTAGIRKIVERIRNKLPDTRILLLGIFPRALRPAPKPDYMAVIRKVNAEIAKLDDGETIRYLDIGGNLLVNGKVSREVMPDGVHLSPKGYEIWAESMKPLLAEMMK